MGDMDCIIKVEANRMEIEKVKDAPKVQAQEFELVTIDGTESVAIKWTGQYQPDKCLDYLKQRPLQKFTARELSDLIGLAQPNVIRKLGQLVKDHGDIYSELSNPEMASSNRNPSVYWFSDDVWTSGNGHHS